MGEARGLAAEQPGQERLAGGGRGEVAAADHLGDAHREIVDHHRELVRVHPVAATQHEVAGDGAHVFAEGPLDGVVDLDLRALRHGQAQGGRAAEGAGRHAVRAAGAGVAGALVAGVGGAGDAGDLGAGAVAEVGEAAGGEQVGGGGVEGDAQGLDVRRGGAAFVVGALVPAEAEPAEIVEDLGGLAGEGAGDVEVFHPEDELALRPARRGRAEEGRGGAAEVEVAGRRGREAAAVHRDSDQPRTLWARETRRHQEMAARRHASPATTATGPRSGGRRPRRAPRGGASSARSGSRRGRGPGRRRRRPRRRRPCARRRARASAEWAR